MSRNVRDITGALSRISLMPGLDYQYFIKKGFKLFLSLLLHVFIILIYWHLYAEKIKKFFTFTKTKTILIFIVIRQCIRQVLENFKNSKKLIFIFILNKKSYRRVPNYI